MTVVALNSWRNNAEMMADVAKLGYLDGTVLDASYGLGRFWTEFRPAHLVTNDLYPQTTVDLVSDARCLPFPDDSFDAVVWDGPYRMSGKRDQAFDKDYGLGRGYVKWQDIMQLLIDGSVEGSRVGKKLLVKCQNQVCSGTVRWQTDEITKAVEAAGMTKIDQFELWTRMRPQPAGRRQLHARRNHSTLLVFSK